MNKKGKAANYIFGFLILVVLTASVYVLLPNSLRIDVQGTKTIFKVYENNSFVIGGTEYTKLFDGTKLMRANKRVVNYTVDEIENITKIYRYAYFKQDILAIDTYTFNGNVNDVELVPVSHNIRIFNANNKILNYEVNDLLYTGVTTKDLTSPQSFGHNMKVEWDDGNYYSRIYKYANKDVGKLEIKYRVVGDDFSANVRLFDPEISGEYYYWIPDNYSINGLPSVSYVSSTTFTKDGNLYAIFTGSNINPYGFIWNGSGWENDTSIAFGLPTLNANPQIDTFYIGNDLYTIIGQNSLFGYVWNGTQWVTNTTINNSLIKGSQYNRLRLHKFEIGSNIYSLTHGRIGTSGSNYFMFGYIWNGTGWENDTSITNGLEEIVVSTNTNLYTFYIEDKLYLVNSALNYGFIWNGSGWVREDSINLIINKGFQFGYGNTMVFNLYGEYYLIFNSNSIKISGYKLTGNIFKSGSGTIEDPFTISTCEELDWMRYFFGYNYLLVNNIDCSETRYWNDGRGWIPIGGNSESSWIGNLDGNGYKIDGLYINMSHNTEYTNGGLFGVISQAEIKNLGVTNLEYIIVNSTMSNVGGLVGRISPNKNNSVNIYNSYSTGNINDYEGYGNKNIIYGGLIGRIWTSSSFVSSINSCYSLVNILVNSSYTGSVNTYMSGLIGSGMRTNVYNSYARGNISGYQDYPRYKLGFMYIPTNTVNIYNSYSTGNVLISNTYSKGFTGYKAGGESTIDSVWDVNTSNQTTSAGGTGLNTTQMKDINTYLDMGWDIAPIESCMDLGTIWCINNTYDYPVHLYSIPDEYPPTYSQISVNHTFAAEPATFRINVTDNLKLHTGGYYIFSTNNTGSWVNDSRVYFTSTPAYVSTTKILNSTDGLTIGYRWYLSDDKGNLATTPIYTLKTEDSSLVLYILPPTPKNNTPMNYKETVINVSVYDHHFSKATLSWNEPNLANSFNDSTRTGNISFSGNQTYKKYVRLPKDSTPLTASLTVKGYYSGNWSSRTIREQQIAQDAEASIMGNSWLLQGITITGEDQIPGSIKLWSYRVGTPGNIVASIRAVNASGYPIGSDLVVGTANASTWSSGSSGSWNEILFDENEVILKKNTQYAIILRVPNGDLINKVNVKYKTIGEYAGGNVFDSINSGSTWNAYPSMDLGFQELGITPSYPIQSWIEVGELDGDYEWSYYGPYDISQTTTDFSDEINKSLNGGLCNVGGAILDGEVCIIPISFHSMGYGKLEYSNISISFSWKEGAKNYSMDCFKISQYNYTCNRTIFNSTFGMDYSFNVFVNDTFGNVEQSGLYTLRDDIEAPLFQDESINPKNNSEYIPGTTIFNISIKEENLETYGISFNGINYTNEDIIHIYNFPYHYLSFNRTALPPGKYNYYWWATDFPGKYNQSSNTYFVSKSLSTVYTYLNGNRNNLTINQNLNVILKGKLIKGDGNIYLYQNGTLIDYGTPEIQKTINFTEPGYYNISTLYSGNAYYMSSYESMFLTVNDIISPNITFVYPKNNSELSKLNPTFNVSLKDNYDLANVTIWIYNTSDEETLLYQNTTTFKPLTKNYNLIFNYTFENEGSFKWYALAFDRSNNNFTTQNHTFSIAYYPDITLIGPEDGKYVVRPSMFDFYVPLNASFIHLRNDTMNISYIDNETHEVICSFENVISDSVLECNWTDKEWFGGGVYSWYINATDGIRDVMSPIYTFTIRDIKLRNVDLDVGSTDVNISWDNWPDQKWVTFYIWNMDGTLATTNFVGTENKSEGYQYMNGLKPDREYRLEWQTGYREVEGDYYSIYFRTYGWKPDLNDWYYKRLITINHSAIESDNETMVLNLTLHDENFNFLDVNVNGTDIRFVDYYELDDLDYNITTWNVPEIIVSSSTFPDEEYYTGTYDNTSYCHDGNWLSRCIANPFGTQYINYTIPETAKHTSVIRAYAGEYNWDGEIPYACFNDNKLKFKIEQNYTQPSVIFYCMDEDNNWIYFWDNGNVSSYFYEMEILWKFPASSNILVKPLHFDDNLQIHVPGVDSGYDAKLWIYYGNKQASSKEKQLEYSGTVDSYTLGKPETHVINPPIISNFNDSINRTETSTTFNWLTDQESSHRLLLSENKWYLNSWYSNKTLNNTEYFIDISGSADTSIELEVTKSDWLELINVTCSVPEYCDNYVIDSDYIEDVDYDNSEKVKITFLDVGYPDTIDWNITYSLNKSWDFNSFSPTFIVENLNPNITYYYRANSTNSLGMTSVLDGSFILGTPYKIPNATIVNYDEDRPNGIVMITGRLNDLNDESEVNLTLQYWSDGVDTEFKEAETIHMNSEGNYTWTINQDYGNLYNYRIKIDATYTGYSPMYQNEFMSVQTFFVGSYIRDDADFRSRQYCTILEGNMLGQINSSDCYEETGVREGSRQQEDWFYVETNETKWGNLTLNVIRGMDEMDITQYNMSWSNVGNFSYYQVSNLTQDWYSLYITDINNNVVLNWTKPGLWRPLHGTRIDAPIWVMYNQPYRDINYTQLYLWPAGYDTESYSYCEANGGDLFTCMPVMTWGSAGLPESLVGNKYDRGTLFAGGVINGGHRDTGFLNETLPHYENVNHELGIGIPGPNSEYNNTGRYCYAFDNYYWQASFNPQNTINNYYVRYWRMDTYYSEYYGYSQESRFDNFCIKAYDDEIGDWGGSGVTNCFENTIVLPEDVIVADRASSKVFETPYDTSLFVLIKDFSETPIDVSGDKIYDIEPYFDAQWTNQLTSKHSQSFIIYNLPSDEILQGMDSDGDGISDYDELYVYYTNPFNKDSDSDGIDDDVEIFISGSNPRQPGDVDIVDPSLSEYSVSPVNNTAYLASTNYKFSVMVTEQNVDKVIFTINNVNYTAYNVTPMNSTHSARYEINFTGLLPNTYKYSWYVNDTFTNEFQSEEFIYVIAEAIVFDGNISLNPFMMNTLAFYPKNSTSKAVQPKYQSEEYGSFIVYNNHTWNALLVIRLESVYNTSWGGNIILKANDENNYSSAVVVTSYFGTVNKDYNKLILGNSSEVKYIWLWADYYSPQRVWQPNLDIMLQEAGN